jgi:isocitrate/isopropylmalate dehydrogenase
METRIKRIIEEDLKAQVAYQQAQERIKNALLVIHKERNTIQDEVWKRAKQYVEDEKIKLTQQLEEAQAQSLITYQASLSELVNNFNEHVEHWRKELLARCLNQP